MRVTLIPLFLTLAMSLATDPILAQTSDQEDSQAGFSLELSVANIGIDGFDTNRLGIGLRPRWCPDILGSRICVWLDICRIPRPWRDPWAGPIGPIPPIGPRASLNDLEVGPGWLIAPAVEFQLRRQGKFRPAIYLGAGIQQVDGRTTDLGARGRFTTESSTSPTVMYGFNFAQAISPRTTLRFQLGAFTTFQEDLEITATSRDSSQRITADGHSVTSGIVGIGLAYRFGG
ncbi:MAG: hypothetical protein K0U98_00105 [Deltaproteobacteria bacterium]|nr:hypothetical protein [Deltaproteobacteria bacterium]